MNRIRLATAPVTWGVWERTIGRDDLISPGELLEVVASLTYAGIELGPPGYLAADSPSRYGLDLCGGFAPLRFADNEHFREDVALWLDPVSDALLASGGQGPVVLADAETPERLAAAGRPLERENSALRPDTFARAMERVNDAVDRCQSRGLTVVFHHHAATSIETPAEIEALLENTDVDICFDTGHAFVGGGDPVEVARLCGDRIAHLHLKDVDGALLERVAAGAFDLEEAWEQGLFCPFGDGVVDFKAVLALPELADFDGWAVIEQDRVAVHRSDIEMIRAVEERNLAVVIEAMGV